MLSLMIKGSLYSLGSLYNKLTLTFIIYIIAYQ